MTQPDPLVSLIAKKFIQRRDVFAVQNADGSYMPAREGRDGPYIGLQGRFIQAHLSGKRTLGHYMLDGDDMCRMFAFDIDFEKNTYDANDLPIFEGKWPQRPDLATWTDSDLAWHQAHVIHTFDPRAAWRDRRHPSRGWGKFQLRMISGMLARSIKATLNLPVAVTYTGNKGIHVYGFTGPLPAEQVQEAAMICLDSLDCFEATRGKVFFKHKCADPIDGYPNLSIEVFPKQTTVSGKGGFGNLMRLPLGVNRKAPKDPTFFVDMNAPMSELRPESNPYAVLQSGNPWQD